MKIVTTDQMRSIESHAVSLGITEDSLMESAGLAIAKRVYQLLQNTRGTRVLVLVGPGNNGGDGMVAGRYLSDWGALVTLYMASKFRREDKLSECEAKRSRTSEGNDDNEHWALSSYLASTDIILDAVFGIGSNRSIKDPIASALKLVTEAKLNSNETYIISVDIPSGLNADEGTVDPFTPYADLTLTLGAPKIGLFKFPGAERTGTVEVLDIGLSSTLGSEISLNLVDKDFVSVFLPKRHLDGHKGTFGRLSIIGGSVAFSGAPLFSAMAAYRMGAGLVSLAIPEEIHPIVASQLPEAIYLPLKSNEGTLGSSSVESVLKDIRGSESAVIGPGLGLNDFTVQFIHQLLSPVNYFDFPMVLDADALNNLAKIPNWYTRLLNENVLTPHPGEMARLLGIDIKEIQSNRIYYAAEASLLWKQTVVLKGAHTVIASPDGQVSLSPIANPALATAGTGDVLAGIIGGLLCQGLSPHNAATLATYIHLQCADSFNQKYGNSGLIASDLINAIPIVVKELSQHT